ncbi:Amidase family protein [Metarhizium album ARSEF 1941]|uniref:Amidase family protein n=1 Tax=Metarhizium album (strain ARSEF 1941) TaxID=1081103 RepID=A0A0B2WW62_METAS|nr:Amidase family protein [Metarhizium album ARSEF 1941]KHN97140.1 Amidase family protein [Metarhizium album ARSEF 1941]
MTGISWQDLTERCQKRRTAAIPTRWRIPPLKLDETIRSTTRPIELLPRLLSYNELQITALGAAELAAKIRNNELSCIQVTEAFCHQAAVAQQLTNCLTEIFFIEALEQARQLDEVLRTTGKPIGPLHGVPVSIKDHIDIKGQHTTAGYVSFARRPLRDDDAQLVEILRKAGAVMYCKTNNSQCMMAVETVNNIYGRTVNPWNTKFGPGGSSGGEGALLAMHGSPLGVGTDRDGSIRIPAAYCGLYAFRPSAKRVPLRASECAMSGQESIVAVAGPLAHNVDDMELFFQVNSDAKPWLTEPLLRMPWTSQMDQMQHQKLRVGVMLWDEVVMPHPYITRVIGEVAKKLRTSGHEVIDFKAYKHKRAWDDILLPLYFTDGGRDIKQTLLAGNEPILPSVKRLLDDATVRERRYHEIWKLNLERDDYRAQYLGKWAETANSTSSGEPIDVLVCPVSPVQGMPQSVRPWWGYCAQWNMLDYPSGVIPAGRVLETDAYPPDYEPANELDRENMNLYDKGLYHDLPVAIQVVAPTHEDERLMGAMNIIDKVVNG